ncbi:MAG: CaiB/BaiF CoA-transferase family protein [Steroidobacteraceae bacterium]
MGDPDQSRRAARVDQRAGPLRGLKVVELAGIGPGPYAGMLLGDLGAEVTRVGRAGKDDSGSADPTLRNRRSITLDLKNREAVQVLLRLVDRSDVLLEGFRPGVAERLGVGPDECCGRNPRLIYARITGWGQSGPLAKTAGHDINYIALSGLLHQIGTSSGKPVAPLNVVGDYGGGGLMAAFGILAALYERERSGRGQVVDTAMIDSSVSFLAAMMGLHQQGLWRDATGGNFLSGAAHFYDTYRTRDGKWLAVGAIEPQFHAVVVRKLNLDPVEFAGGVGFMGAPYDELVDDVWPALKVKLAEAIGRYTRDELEQLFAGTDACVTPVLSMEEAARHPHNIARSVFVEVGGAMQNAPVPRFSRSKPDEPRVPRRPGADGTAILEELGYSAQDIAALTRSGALPG